MRKRTLMTFVLCMFLVLTQAANACWAYLTIEELVEKSDIIVMGEVVSKLSGSIKEGDIGYNKWRVKVHYYIKGHQTDSEIIVGTPDEKTSLYYDLDTQGNQVILFLQDRKNYFLPHSPQSVVGISFNDEKTGIKPTILGDEILKSIKINEQNITYEEKENLKKYLSEEKWVGATSNDKEIPIAYNPTIALIGISTAVGLILIKLGKRIF